MRLAYLQVSAFLFLEFCKNGADRVRIVANKLPDDARFIRAGHDNLGSLYLVLESEEFIDLKEGEEIPRLPDVMLEKV